MPPSRSCRKARSSSIRFTVPSPWCVVRSARGTATVPGSGDRSGAGSAVVADSVPGSGGQSGIGNAHLQSGSAGFLDGAQAVFLGQGKNAQDAANRQFALAVVENMAELADVGPGPVSAPQQLPGAQRCPWRTVALLDGMHARLLAEVLTQELSRLGVQQANVDLVPLHFHLASDPARWCAVVGGLDLDTAVQLHGALAELVLAERFQRQRQQRRTLLGKHGGHLSFGGAVNAGVGPVLLPVVEIGLCFFQAFEAQSFQRRPLRVAHARL